MLPHCCHNVRMFRQGAKWLLVTMLTLSLGFHWVVLQSAAWVGMVVKYSGGCGFKEAIGKTFDGKHPCKLCRLVSEGKNTEKKSEAQFDIKKVDSFAGEANAPFQFSKCRQAKLCCLFEFSSRLEPPASPPPKFFAASLS